ncbi:MAG: ankyrin repeat domain-containing protein [Gammaproteobacteria bacterium]|nr:ankyrin repeat domain-containing protein [Gammaproteobacteria bacterium]NIR85608.1 ankyrin repeat domain-containing protein [Gammaproteobacteria bacterium]NIV75324.1 hypothetical protein [Gammaproteobacteria bacterium]
MLLAAQEYAPHRRLSAKRSALTEIQWSDCTEFHAYGSTSSFGRRCGRPWPHHGQRRSAGESIDNRGAPIDAVDRYGVTPLHRAASRDDDAMLELLLRGGADPNVRSERYGAPLHRASHFGRVEVSRLLLDAGRASRAPQGGGASVIPRRGRGRERCHRTHGVAPFRPGCIRQAASSSRTTWATTRRSPSSAGYSPCPTPSTARSAPAWPICTSSAASLPSDSPRAWCSSTSRAVGSSSARGRLGPRCQRADVAPAAVS